MTTPAPPSRPAPATGATAVRERMAAAARRIRRLKRIDRAAVGIITLGGVGIIIAVLGILVFIAAEAVPLFKSAQITPEAASSATTGLNAENARAFRAFGVDEYRRYAYAVEPGGALVLLDIRTGTRARTLSVPGLDGATITCSSQSLEGTFVAAGTSDGRVSLLQLRFTPRYEGATRTDVDVEVRPRGIVEPDTQNRPVRQVAYKEQDGRQYVAALVADDEIAYWWTDETDGEHRATLRVALGHSIEQVRIGRAGAVAAGTSLGRVYHWLLEDEQPRLTDVSPVSGQAVTALEWVLGGNSFVAAAADGSVSGWFRAPAGPNGEQVMVRAHAFEPQGAAVTGISMSTRDRSFATAGADGSVVLRHQTSERTLGRTRLPRGPSHFAIAPKSDGLVAIGGGQLMTYGIANAHPETNWKTLFGQVWYEGYARPEYVWQSTGGTDDFEPKLSLVPLVFGTIKGTFYALLFAVPIAVFGALYTSQFVHPSIKTKIKPTVEIMAALPSVVIGFIAGLYLSTVVERNLVAVFLMFVLLPLSGTAGVLVWHALPRPVLQRLKPGTEVLLIVPLLLVAAWLALRLGPWVEAIVFRSDVRAWLGDVLGVTYDQRNSLVVGLAMGFAVIPIIFTISEDAFSSVPQNLTAASLALGASRWQTAVRVVLPTASPGVFSATMIGFGRAVGETMIVLMATGNTPLLDWSMFNGMRTLSANIAVEIPEAPYGGTLYRTLFLTAALLFVMTFAVNTLAELVRQRLRDRYKAI